jgi:hypothetical protein
MNNEKLTDKPAARLPLVLDVEYRKNYARNSELGRLKNISLTGAFLQSSNIEIQPRDKIVLTIIVSGRARKVQASVIWRNQAGCGVRFQPGNNRDVQIVDDLIYFVENQRTSRRSVLDDIFKQVG